MSHDPPHGLRRIFSASLGALVALSALALLAPACSDAPPTLVGEPPAGGEGAEPDAATSPAPSPSATTPPTPTGTGTGTAPPAPPPGPPAAEPSDPVLKGIVAAHNAARAAVVPAPATPLPQMQWSESDAEVARAYAAKCVFAHNAARGPRGENLYANSGGTKSPAAVVGSWVSEAKNYTYATNQCSGVCGHYTQVVWRDSVKVGCAMQRCTVNSPFGGGAWDNWVCDYSPAGNFVGRKPY
jgi:pathogenesis-related protein 1